jgi:rRNA-processing protein FCF1
MDYLDYCSYLTIKYKNKGLLVDTNLLLVYFVGSYDIERPSTFKRTDKYTIDDYITIARLIDYFRLLLTTPHILTEVSNLSNQLPDKFKENYYQEFKKQVTVLKEIYEPSITICDCECFGRLGLTDSCISMISKGKYLVLTDDLPLSNHLRSLNIDVLNLNHIRSLR